ncbi:CAP domain-containing protein [Neisseria sp.]|uniref:CAP domain-containing protein n=1 Tax=Neisseria sp. TaxID=192066 RepID=UPI0035A0178E
MKSLFIWLAAIVAIYWLFSEQQKSERRGLQKSLIQARDARSDAGGISGFDYLNRLRSEAGLKPFKHSPVLETAARSHARYLAAYPEEQHGQRKTADPLFSGADPNTRAAKAGYLSRSVEENLTTETLSDDENGRIADFSALGARMQIDNLMSAIYHRFSLLDPYSDEAGAASHASGRNRAFVIEQASGLHNGLCRLNHKAVQPGRSYYTESCNNGAVVYTDEYPAGTAPAYTVFPVGRSAIPEFQNETPNPLPDIRIAGNPASIDFHNGKAKIEMLSFKLYQGGKEVKPVRVLSAKTDPNRKLTGRQFALFPLKPLAYDTAYRAVFRYKSGGREQTVDWTFRTQKPVWPYFIVNGGEKLSVKAERRYFLHWKDDWCAEECANFRYVEKGGARLKVHKRTSGGLVFSLTGEKGGRVSIASKNNLNGGVEIYIR